MPHLAEPMGELIRCFDEAGKETEPHSREEVHKKPLKFWHAVSAIILVNQNAEILCSKRSEQLSQRPGVWQTNFGGHVNAGQSFEENAVLELASEAGIVLNISDLHFLGEFKNQEFKHIGKYYVSLFNGKLSDLHFSDGEVTEAKFMPMTEAWQEKISHPELWAGGCPPERQKQIKEWLKNNNYIN